MNDTERSNYEAIIERHRIIALAAARDDARFHVEEVDDEPRLAVNCNDLFYYATSDSELVPVGMEVEFFHKTSDELITWCEEVRGMKSIPTKRKEAAGK